MQKWIPMTLAQLETLNPNVGIDRIQVFTASDQRDSLKEVLMKQNYPVTITTIDRYIIDLGPQNCIKVTALKHLCEQYRLSLDVIVIGDSENDVAMFANAKHSYCMATAESQVLAQAAHSTTSVAALIQQELK